MSIEGKTIIAARHELGWGLGEDEWGKYLLWKYLARNWNEWVDCGYCGKEFAAEKIRFTANKQKIPELNKKCGNSNSHKKAGETIFLTLFCSIIVSHQFQLQFRHTHSHKCQIVCHSDEWRPVVAVDVEACYQLYRRKRWKPEVHWIMNKALCAPRSLKPIKLSVGRITSHRIVFFFKHNQCGIHTVHAMAHWHPCSCRFFYRSSKQRGYAEKKS